MLASPALTGQQTGESRTGSALHNEQDAEKHRHELNGLSRGLRDREADEDKSCEDIKRTKGDVRGLNHVCFLAQFSHNWQAGDRRLALRSQDAADRKNLGFAGPGGDEAGADPLWIGFAAQSFEAVRKRVNLHFLVRGDAVLFELGENAADSGNK